MRSPPLPYQVCNPEPLLGVAENDSVRQRAILDSVATLFAGRWQLVEVGAGACFAPPYAPAEYTEMTLNRQGQGVVRAGGRRVTSFRLLLSFYWGYVRFAMNEEVGYFNFRPPYKSKKGRYSEFEGRYLNVLRVCEETLMLTGPRTGLSYVFKRLPAW